MFTYTYMYTYIYIYIYIGMSDGIAGRLALFPGAGPGTMPRGFEVYV